MWEWPDKDRMRSLILFEAFFSPILFLYETECAILNKKVKIAHTRSLLLFYIQIFLLHHWKYAYISISQWWLQETRQ